jgi:hypothetical protein
VGDGSQIVCGDAANGFGVEKRFAREPDFSAALLTARLCAVSVEMTLLWFWWVRILALDFGAEA